MSYKNVLIVSLIGLFLFQNLDAQIGIVNQFDEGDRWSKKIAQVDEFIHYINFDGLSSSQEKRKQQLVRLFDESYYNRNKSTLTPFLQNCLSKPQPISYYDDNWYAKTRCKIRYKGKVEEVDIYLSVSSTRPDYRSKWVMVGAYAHFMDVQFSCNDQSKMISPNNHQVGFLALHRAFKDKDNISVYTKKNYSPDYLSILLYETKNRNVELLEIVDITYYFTQIKDWVFVLKYFNRKSSNAGWLISKTIKISEKKKHEYITNTLHINE